MHVRILASAACPCCSNSVEELTEQQQREIWTVHTAGRASEKATTALRVGRYSRGVSYSYATHFSICRPRRSTVLPRRQCMERKREKIVLMSSQKCSSRGTNSLPVYGYEQCFILQENDAAKTRTKTKPLVRAAHKKTGETY